jgi:hypothetical protein
MLRKSVGYYLLALTAFVLFLSGCKKQDLELQNTTIVADQGIGQTVKRNYSNEVATRWFDQELNLIKSTAGFTPPLASRALGYTGVVLYESIVANTPEYATLQSKLGFGYRLPAYSQSQKFYWPAVANAALRSIVSDLFSTTNAGNRAAIEALYANLHEKHAAEVKKEDLDASEEYGKAVAKAVFDWSGTDGIQRSFTNYTPDQYTLPVFDGAWVPTAPAFAQPLLPFWGDNRPFLAKNVGSECLPTPLSFPYSTDRNSTFYKMANEVYQINKSLTPAQEQIALYWNDGANSITPPGHNMSIATQMIRKNDLSLNDAAVVYAKVGMACADAFIACWKGKYSYSLLRPITYIRQNIDANWVSLIPTPPFPTYGSGHATVSGATSAVLTEIFGDNVRFTDNTYESSFGSKEFKSFYEAAEEAAMSRLYGGIHYRFDNEIGLQKGKMIGKNIADLRLKR